MIIIIIITNCLSLSLSRILRVKDQACSRDFCEFSRIKPKQIVTTLFSPSEQLMTARKKFIPMHHSLSLISKNSP